jgi:hypothetical protein
MTSGRVFSYERYAHLKHWCLVSFRRQQPHKTHQRPNSILVLDVIEHPQLSRHSSRHVEQTAPLDGMLKRKAGSEGRDVDETSDLHPLKVRRLTTVHTYLELQS